MQTLFCLLACLPACLPLVPPLQLPLVQLQVVPRLPSLTLLPPEAAAPAAAAAHQSICTA